MPYSDFWSSFSIQLPPLWYSFMPSPFTSPSWCSSCALPSRVGLKTQQKAEAILKSPHLFPFSQGSQSYTACFSMYEDSFSPSFIHFSSCYYGRASNIVENTNQEQSVSLAILGFFQLKKIKLVFTLRTLHLFFLLKRIFP